MAESTVYIVLGSTGEYSDRSEWLVRAHRTEGAAQADVEALTAKWAELSAGTERWEDDRDKAILAMKAFDPRFEEDYTGTRWWVQAVPLVDA